MKRLIPIIFFTACISIDHAEPIKFDEPSIIYISGYSDTPIIDTLQIDNIKVYIELKKIKNGK